ncbi:hypothetical protein SLEP1_g24130 [Rubroshorea leprosula]|uniref:Uncharacterized protein n=1 Tax=Rubroshorea leprosula TaxID=152421 RepID=A0AAV5JJU2_9ROSI|nr:hypothetical protein SLEP1_g24130 [Rubroshorea leprosula]
MVVFVVVFSALSSPLAFGLIFIETFCLRKKKSADCLNHGLTYGYLFNSFTLLLYFRTPHFKVFGRPLSPAFKAEMLGPSGNFVLKALSYTQPWTVAQETRKKQRYLA